MNQRSTNTKWIGALLLLILLVSACTPEAPAPTEPPQVSTPTTDVLALTQTVEVLVTAARETVVAELTAQAPASPTSPPTNTPIVVTATLDGTAATQQATAAVPTSTTAPAQQATLTTGPAVTNTAVLTTCQVVSQNPAFGQDFSPGEDLDLRWTIRNTSSQQWNQGEVDYSFVSGTEFHRQAIYDLPETVQVNDEVDIIVDVLAPAQPGRYSATWAIVRGGQRLCTMSATIDVVE